MSRLLSKFLVVFALGTPSAFAQYTYSVVDTTMSGPPSSHWTTSNGAGTDMLAPTGDYSYGGEVRAVVVSPGFQIYLATNDCYASLGCNITPGNYTTGYQLTVYGNSATLQSTWLNPFNSTLQTTTLATHSIPAVFTGSIVRAVCRPDPAGGVDVILYVTSNLGLFYHDTDPLAHSGGGIGFNFSSGSAASFVSEGDAGMLDTVAPNAVPSGSITPSSNSYSVRLQWPAATDNANGIGVFGYQILRDGVLMATNREPNFYDNTTSPSSTYNYTVRVTDFHWNTTDTTISVSTPVVPTNPPYPSATPDGFRTGVKPTGTYWGAGNENIDVMSGNLSFSLPLLKAQARTGWSVPFTLSYNSQNWGQSGGAAWQMGGDVGVGFGWTLMAGSITPVWSGSTATLYFFKDSTGAEYRLDQNDGNVWRSKESTYVYFDANVDVLHFRDGSFWNMGCVSAGTEADSGVMYPTVLEDANGNQIQISYNTSAGASWTNSSSRINTITDVRGSTSTYTFTYNTDSVPHLTAITNSISTGEQYTFAYATGQSIQSPISGQLPGTTTFLTGATVTGLNMTTSFSYNGSGEMTEALLPYGGYLKWDYDTVLYSSGVSYREVQHRYLSKDGTTGSQTTYTFSHEPSVTTVIHQYTKLDDPGGIGEKYWQIGQSSVGMGLVTQYQGRQLPGPVTKTQNDFTWSLDGVGNSYISSTLNTLDTGQSYQAQSKTTQTVDNYGNVSQVNSFNYGNLSTPARTSNYTYLNTSPYTSRYIFNRILTASVTNGTTTIPLATITYDGTLSTVTNPSSNWDTAYSTVTTRGNVLQSVTPNNTTSYTYNQLGVLASVTSNGVTTSVTTSNSNSYAAPTQLSVGGLSTSLSWSPFLGLTNETGPNSDSSSTYFDSYARKGSTTAPQTSTTSPFFATTTYAYSNPPYNGSEPATVTATTNGRWTKTTLDGLGRTIMIQTGDGSGTKSQTDTVYGSCGCSPTGKMLQQSMPHATNVAAVWTTYTYDGIGRTLSVVAPDGASTTAYQYKGNTVTVTDPAGKWKIFTMDAFGNLTQVDEPNPGSGVEPEQPVSPPTFSPAPGTYGSSQSVTLNTVTSGATIRYTTDGSTPTKTNGTIYSAPISVISNASLKAIAYVSSMADSAVISITYTISSGGGSGPAWYNTAWTYRKPITIAHGQVSGTSSLTNFPVLLSWASDSNLTPPNVQTNGNDILFTASDGVTKLNHEIEGYTSSTGKLTAWVKMPSLSPTTDTVLYMYYGNSSASNQQNVTGSWDSSYTAVYHVSETSGQHKDSTSNANNSTAVQAAVQGSATGQIGGADTYSNSGDKTTLPAFSLGTSPFTVSAWVNGSNWNSTARVFLRISGAYNETVLSVNSSNQLQFQAAGTPATASSAVANGTWYHVVGTTAGAGNTVTLYVNGVSVGTATQGQSNGSGTGSWFGGDPYTGAPSATFDEARISVGIARSADWILTEYRNQSSPGTFFSEGAQQTQGSGGTGWYNTAWGYRKAITIAHGQVSGTQQYFPVLISTTDSNLATSAQSNGNDILFTSADGITKLAHEIETYTSSTGQLNAWVNVPSLSSTTDTVVYMYYGDPAATNQQYPTGAYDSSFKGVWHLPNGSTLTAADSTSNANGGTISGAGATSGKIGGAGSFNGSSSSISVGNASTLQITGTITMSAWVNVAAFPPLNTNNWDYIIGKGYDGTSEGYYLRLNAQTNPTNIQLNAGSFNGSTNYSVLWTISGWNTNTWHHVVGTYDGTAWKLYFDGVLQASNTQGTGAVGSGYGAYLGAQNIAGSMQRFWNGSLDEVRISNSSRSAGWITTEYNNQSSPSTFYFVGSQQTQGGGGSYPTPVGMPTFSSAPGSYNNSVTVTLASSTSGSSIRYTTDGTTPTETAGTIYSGGITLNSSITIKAIAYATGMADSEISTGTYSISISGGGADYLSNYTYDLLNNLTQVSMPRPSGTQTRTFVYNGKLLTSATNPENGTVNYTYGSNNKVATKTDAKGQAIKYNYDSLNRLYQVQRFPSGLSGAEDTCQQENYYYDSNPFNPAYSQYAAGRLAAVQYYAPPGVTVACSTIKEQYSYNQAGEKTNKGLLMTRTLRWTNGSGASTVDLESSYTYDSEGRMLSVQYPGSTGGSAGPNLGYAYDTMGRLNTMTDIGTSTSVISATSYNPANQLLTIIGNLFNENRSYNSMGQLTNLSNNSVRLAYGYSNTQNNGKIISQIDGISGEQVVYAYDALNRLSSAGAIDGSWGQSYGYDGFGNLTDQNVTASGGGTVPTLSVVYNASTNRQTTDSADLNGNIQVGSYDVENHLVSVPGGTQYAYAPGNKRIWRGTTTYNNGNSLTVDELTFWGVNGQKLGTYTVFGDPNITYSGPTTLTVQIAISNYYFGGKLVGKRASGTTSYFGTDRLGSIGKYYPWGQERGTGNPASGEKFTGYFRDSETQLDYADQRYHQPGMGRFTSPDPYRARSAGANPSNPGSWNKYAYVVGDPINFSDPTGEFCMSVSPASAVSVECGTCDPSVDPQTCCNFFNNCEPGPDPDPPPPPPPPTAGCSLTLATTGTPRNGQNLVGLTDTTPDQNQLGGYQTASGNPFSDGWFFAVQIQGNLSGDTIAGHWFIGQTLALSGTVQVDNGLPGQFFSTFVQNDSPHVPGAIYQGLGNVDWLDAPGFLSYTLTGDVIGASITWKFQSSLTNAVTGDICRLNWSVSLNVNSNGYSIGAGAGW